jgi:tellurite resistance-related uncharacterized protein
MTLPVVFTANGAQGYNLTNSLRFRASASAYLNRTFATGNRRTFTWSGWLKRGSLTGNQALMSPYTNGTGSGTYGVLRFVDGSIEFFDYTNGTYNAYFYTSSSQYTFRDPSAWYHIVLAVDTTQATGSNRIKIYVNGTQITGTFYATPTQNYDLQWNNNLVNYIGYTPTASQYFDGYLAEVNFIDGQALTPSSFGATSSTTGVWQPIKYTGTYGTNGFYLPFTDNSALTTSSNAGLGKDFSGNANYWTTNNISITSGATYDSMTDVPTLTSATASNFSVMNPLTSGTQTTLTGANLNLSQPSGSNVGNSRSTFAMTTGKWYMEVTLTANASTVYPQIGIMTARDGSRPNNDYPQAGYSTSMLDPTLSVIYMADGQKQTNGSASSYGSSFTNGDVIGVAIDSDNGAIYFSKNGTFQNSGVPTSGSSKTGAALTWTGGTVEEVLSIAGYNGTAQSVNFGQRPFAYTPPTGFKELNTFNLPTPTIGATASTQANKYFDVSIYTGTGALTQSVTNSNSMQPDFVWVKDRSQSTRHVLTDSVRGSGISLYSNTTDSEGTNDSTGYLSAFNSNGFTLNRGSGGLGERVNYSGDAYVGWQWRASNATAVTNTQGTITSTVSANTSAGFSIVTYTGNGTSGATVGHGLGVAPSMYIVKSRSAANNWCVYHVSLGNQYATLLNSTAGSYSNSNYWNNTSPTSTVFSLGNGGDTNQSSATFVAYCFAQIAGYSAFGSYTGNGSSDGTFVFTGFRPRYVMFKRTDTTANWTIRDTARNPYNSAGLGLFPNLSAAEDSTAGRDVDILSNGFKIRGTDSDLNTNGGTYIYAAFCESPFKYANAR